jgi:streptomycin 6-kinase
MHDRPRQRNQPPVSGRPRDLDSESHPASGEPFAAGRTEGFPFDPDFPQLPIATNPDIMLGIFRAKLKPVAGKRYEIQDCKPFRFRCRQSKSRHVLQYTLRIADPSTGRRWDQSVTGILYADERKAERRWQEMQAKDPTRGIPSEWLTFEPVDIIPSLGMLVQIFPYDRRLRTLGPVMGDAARRVDPLLLTRLGPGEWEVEDRKVEPARYRTERGAALRYVIRARDVRSARHETLTCYLKVYRNERGQETWEFLQLMAGKAEAGPRPYDVIRPIAYLTEHRTLAIEEAPGLPLNQLLLRAGDPVEAVRPAARALAAFHQDDIPATRHESLADRLEAIRNAATLVEWACPGAQDTIRAITAEVTAGLEEAPPTPIHGDLKPDHLFVAGRQVVFIDLDSVAFGDPVRDVASLFALIASRAGMRSMPADRARATAAAFVDEYFRHTPSSWGERLPLHCAGAFLEVATGIFRSQEPGWREMIAWTIEAAQRACQEVPG